LPRSWAGLPSIERTAYPRFGRVVPTRELHDVYTPDLAEVEWARGVTRSDVHLLALVVLLKCFQRLGYFPQGEEIPAVVIQRVRGCLDLAADISVAHDSEADAASPQDADPRPAGGTVRSGAGSRDRGGGDQNRG